MYFHVLWKKKITDCLGITVADTEIQILLNSHASMLIELGFSPLEIANRLGHEKVETTLNTYAHLYPNKQTKLAERLDSEYREDL